LADATYQSTTVASLLSASHYLLLVGFPAAALSLYRSRSLPGWTAVPFVVAAVLQAVALFPQSGSAIAIGALPALYLALATLGMAILSSARKSSVSAVRPHGGAQSTYREDSPPAAQ
jgi:hypothetical protein